MALRTPTWYAPRAPPPESTSPICAFDVFSFDLCSLLLQNIVKGELVKAQIVFPAFCIFMTSLFVISCTQEQKKTDVGVTVAVDVPGGANWKNQMHSLETALSELYPLAFDSSQFQDPANEKKIEANLKIIRDLARDVNHSPMAQISDPSLQFISIDFKEQMDMTWSSFVDKKKEFARFNVLHLSSYCIECHTRNSYGPSFGSEKLSQKLQTLSVLERAEYLTAVRNFDKALDLYNEYFKNSSNSYNDFFKAEKAAQSAMAITVRFQKSKENTEKFIKSMQSAKNLPLYLKRSLDLWLKDVKIWRNEKKSNLSVATIRKRLDQANIRRFEGGSLAGQVLVLRSLSDLHDLLLKPLKKDELSETLYLLGLAYSQTESSLFLNLDEKYFETCIRRNPKNPWAKKCFEKLEESLALDYSGSAGVFIPVDVKNRLEELRKLGDF